MPYRFFVIPVRDPADAERDLNGFLASHQIQAVDRRFVDVGDNSYWTLCVDYLAPGTNPAANGRGASARGKIDYRERLQPADFNVFSQLRDLRKEIAQAGSVPVYTIFSNEQLAQMVLRRAITKSTLEQIAGVGDARIDKYGERFLERLCRIWEPTDEANRPAV